MLLTTMKTLLIAITTLLVANHAFSIPHQLLVHDLRKDFLKLEDELWKFILGDHTDNTIDPGITVIRKFYDFDQKVQKMPQEILYGLEVVRETKEFVFLYSELRVILDLYDKFQRYQLTNLMPTKNFATNRRQISTSDMVDDILYDKKNNVNTTLVKIFDKLFGSKKDNIIMELFDIVSADNYNCKHNQTAQQVFYNLYNMIALTDLKGYMMMQFAYLASHLPERGNNTKQSLLIREEYKLRANNTMSTLRGFLEVTSGKKWTCDPEYHVEGETFVQITRLLQGHVQNEVDLNSERSCKQTCSFYNSSKSYGCYDSGSEYCKRRKPCNGKILNCQFIESDMEACISPPNSTRRYEFIRFSSGRVMGDSTSCYNRDVESWHRWFVHCSYCMCLCDEKGLLSDRYLNIRLVVADVENNRVVTGLRIIKYNRIIHLQIQEGKLLPYGYIDNSTVKWVPVDDFKITDPGISSGTDYHTLTNNDRTILLNELQTYEDNEIITGVRFEHLYGHVRLVINVTPFNFKEGTLSKESYWVFGNGLRNKIALDHLNIPTKSKTSTPMWGPNQYLQFTHTDFNMDVAQTTIPFFDSQPVTTYPPIPLKGVGIYYKGGHGYGGFIAPSIITHDFSNKLEIEFPDPDKRDDSMDISENLVN